MKEYIHRFNAESDYANYVNSAYTEPWVSTIGGGGSTSSVTVTYNLYELAEPLTFEIVSGGTLYWKGSGHNVDVKVNNGEWETFVSSNTNSGTTIAELNAGDIIKFRFTTGSRSYEHSTFKQTDDLLFYAYGNIMSLVNFSNFRTNNSLRFANIPFAGTLSLKGLMSHPTKILHFPATIPSTYSLNKNYLNMFNGCKLLERAPQINKNFPSVSDGMFCNCVSLTSIDLDCSKITSLGVSAFENCNNIMFGDLKFENLTSIGYKAFKNCTGITKISSLGKIKSLGVSSTNSYGTFENCHMIKECVLPETLVTIGNDAFHECTSLSKINLPESLQNIGADSFKHTQITNDINLPNLKTIGGSAFWGTKIKKITNLGNINFPTDNFADRAVFGFCRELEEAVLPETVTRISNYAFQNCTKLFRMSLPSSLTELKYGVFSACTSLSEVICKAEIPPTLNNAFIGCTSLSAIYVPPQSVEDYKTSSNWSNFASIIQPLTE